LSLFKNSFGHTRWRHPVLLWYRNSCRGHISISRAICRLQRLWVTVRPSADRCRAVARRHRFITVIIIIIIITVVRFYGLFGSAARAKRPPPPPPRHNITIGFYVPVSLPHTPSSNNNNDDDDNDDDSNNNIIWVGTTLFSSLTQVAVHTSQVLALWSTRYTFFQENFFFYRRAMRLVVLYTLAVSATNKTWWILGEHLLHTPIT